LRSYRIPIVLVMLACRHEPADLGEAYAGGRGDSDHPVRVAVEERAGDEGLGRKEPRFSVTSNGFDVHGAVRVEAYRPRDAAC